MSISRKNAEGYFDPTAHKALTAVAKAEKPARNRPLIYIASPFRGDTEQNTQNVIRYSALT